MRERREPPPHSEVGRDLSLHLPLSDGEARNILERRKQEFLSFEKLPTLEESCPRKEPPIVVPPDIETFAKESGRSRFLNTEGFRYIPGQIEGLLHLDQSEKNAIVAASTGAGKSYVACAEAARYLEQFPEKRVLLVTRQRQLVTQIIGDACRSLTLDESAYQYMTGAIPPSRRASLYRGEPKFFFATPQTIRNDLNSKTVALDLNEYSLILMDEIHQSRKNDAGAEILRAVGALETPPRVVAFSATPYMTPEERTALMKLLGEDRRVAESGKMDRVDRILVNVPTGKKTYIRHDVALTPAVRIPAAPLEEGIRDAHAKIVGALSGYPALERRAISLLRIADDHSVGVATENQTTSFAHDVRECVEPDVKDSPWRSNLLDHIYVLGALGRYHRYLTGTGRFFFLDRVGKELTEANLLQVEGKDGKLRSAMFGDTKSGQNWFYRMLSMNRELGMYKFLLEESYRRVSEGTEFGLILDKQKVRTIADLALHVEGLDHEDLHEALSDEDGKPRYKSSKSLLRDIFGVLQRNVAQRESFYDHPLTEKVISLLESHIRYKRPGNVLLYSKYYDDAVFLAEYARRKFLRQYS
jgi:hypothetical protein